jgi:hypothetical protein
MAGVIEQKAVAAPAVTLVAGYLSAVLISAVPWLHDHLTADQQQNLPIVIAFILSGVAAYVVPHTHRPDLAPVVAPPPPRVLPSRPVPPPAPPAPPPPPDEEEHA